MSKLLKKFIYSEYEKEEKKSLKESRPNSSGRLSSVDSVFAEEFWTKEQPQLRTLHLSHDARGFFKDRFSSSNKTVKFKHYQDFIKAKEVGSTNLINLSKEKLKDRVQKELDLK